MKKNFLKLLDVNEHEIKCMVTANQDFTFLVTPYLDIYPCCSQCIENTILKMGNLKENTLEEILSNIKYNKVLYTIFTQGFTPFLEIMKKENIEFPLKLSSHCEMCEYLFPDEWFLKPLMDKQMI